MDRIAGMEMGWNGQDCHYGDECEWGWAEMRIDRIARMEMGRDGQDCWDGDWTGMGKGRDGIGMGWAGIGRDGRRADIGCDWDVPGWTGFLGLA